MEKKKERKKRERERNWCTVIGYVKWAKIHFKTLFKSALKNSSHVGIYPKLQ